MPLTAEQRQGIIQDLVTNCDCWKGQDDASTLNTFSDNQLIALGRQNTIAKMATKGFKDPIGNAFRVNPDTGQWEGKRSEPTPTPTPAKKTGKGAAPTSNAKGKGAPDEEDEEYEEEDEEDEEEVARENKRRMAGKGKKPTGNTTRRRPMTDEEWYEAAPDHLRNSFRFAQQMEAGERDRLIAKLSLNYAEEERPQRTEWLKGQGTEVLQNMAAMKVEPPAKKRSAPAANNAVSEEDSETLPLPTINFGDEEEQRPARNTSSSYESPTSDNDEDVIAALPVSVRNEVMEARRTNQRELDALIEQLTANSTADDETLERLTRRWSKMRPDELRDLLALSPARRGSSGVANVYFGAGAPLGNTGRGFALSGSGGGMEDEVLPLPKLNFNQPEEDEEHSKKRKVAR